MSELQGVFVAMVTPFDDDGNVNIDGLLVNAEWLIEQGVHGLMPLGSTGDFASLEDSDKQRITDAVLESVAGRVPVIVGATAETTEQVIANARYAEKAGASGVLVLPPYYYSPSQEELYDHYRRIGNELSIPVMIYNNPGSSKVDVEAHTAARLSKLPQLRYIKESTSDIKRITAIRMLTDDKMCIFCGWEDMAYESFLMGARGWICVIGNILPQAAIQLYELVAVKKDYAQGWQLYRRMLPMLRYLEYSGKSQKAIKYVLDKMGLAGGRSSSPKEPLAESDKQMVNGMLEEFNKPGE